MNKALLTGLAVLPVAASAQSMLTLHETMAGGACYPAPLGQVFQASLPANAGTGYVWAKQAGDGVEQVGDVIVGRPAGGGMVMGGPQIQTLRFRATEPGRHILTLGLARPFERGAAPIRTLGFCLQTPAR